MAFFDSAEKPPQETVIPPQLAPGQKLYMQCSKKGDSQANAKNLAMDATAPTAVLPKVRPTRTVETAGWQFDLRQFRGREILVGVAGFELYPQSECSLIEQGS